MADLAQLMEIAPTVGAGFIGQNQAMQQREQEAKLMELAQLIQSRQGQEQRAQSMHPFELDKMRLGNESTSAMIPGQAATSRKLGVDASIAEATQGSTIEAKDSKNRMETYREVGQHLGSLSRAISDNQSVPPHAAFAQALDQVDLPPQRKQKLMQRYTNVPAAKLQERLAQDGAAILRENDRYAQAFDTTELTTSANLVNSEYNRQSAERMLERQIESGRFVKSPGKDPATVEDQLRKAKTAREKAEILEAALYEAVAKGDTETAQAYLVRAQEARQRAAEDASNMGLARGQNDISVPGMTQLPANAAPQATAPIGGSVGAKPAPAANRGSGERVKVVSPDGKVGTIPAEQLEQALKKGFKRQ
jgi:hypothetical protein